ncbi:MAG: glycosyltransferase family 2 protein, partial [Blastocatellia bacterium]
MIDIVDERSTELRLQPLVYVIVLNYRMLSQTTECLKSLLQLSYRNYRIVVVDNGSGDGIESAVKSQFPAVTVIQTGANLGYTGGNNAGIEYALGNGADYVLVVNPDTVTFNPKFVDEMVDYLESHPEVGIAGPRVFLREIGNVQNTVLFAPGLWRSVTNWFRFRIDPQSLEFSGGEVVEAEVINGVCLLIRAGCLRQVGLFDENVFMYIEDADMDYRARQQGWQVKYLPIDSVIHRQKREGYHLTGLASFLLKRNSVYYLCKIGKRLEAWGYAIFSLTLLFARAVLTLNKKNIGAYLQFIGRLAAAYRVILFNR